MINDHYIVQIYNKNLCKSNTMPNFVQAECHENLFSMAEAQPKLSKFI